MKWLVLLWVLLPVRLAAQDMALEYYSRCVGPAYEQQAVAKYENLSCRLTQSCAPFDPSDFAGQIETDCVSISVEICLVLDEPDTCVAGVIEKLRMRTQDVASGFPISRVEAAARGKESLLARSLMLQLERSQEVLSGTAADLCPTAAEIRLFESFGVEEEALCHLREASFQSRIVYQIKARTLELEALDE
ncbi:hypothetical protein [Yoonia sp. BS5-3]|uniref:Uncharacterized protein n=1 Tax=Yoonia phaeophyticola TaxID=3137369 RepID=A0ABZ3IE49_9RHOB